KNAINELFTLDSGLFHLTKSYFKLHILEHHKNDQRLEKAQIVLVINQYNNLILRFENHMIKIS
ncbi:unnamed protein product, partial [Rotaria sp. Silwood2]